MKCWRLQPLCPSPALQAQVQAALQRAADVVGGSSAGQAAAGGGMDVS